jgi:long-chain fatty acid transport protein
MTTTNTGRALTGAAIALAMLVFWTQGAQAAGFAIKEQSTTALGNAFAGATTGIDDLSYSFFNPAMMTYLEGNHAAASASYIFINFEFDDGEASTTPPINAPINPTAEFDGNDDIGEDAFIPAVYGMWSYSDKLKFGLGVTAPFGLATDNPDGWIGRYHALRSDLVTIDINPTVAYRVNDALSIGAGFRAVYADAELTSAVDFGTIGALSAVPGSIPTQQDGKVELDADAWGFGGNVGIMFEPGKLVDGPDGLDGLRLGLAYRSRVSLDLEGEADFKEDSAGIAATLQGAGLFTDPDAKADLTLPDTISFGINYDINDEWAVMGEAVLTFWSTFDELVAEFDDNTPDNVTTEDWENVWFFALGTTYRPKWQEDLTLRFGVAFDESPIPDDTRTPRLPGNDRYWVALGADYSPYPWLNIALGYTHIFVKDGDIDLEATLTNENATRGNLSGEFTEAQIDIIALQGSIKF